MIITSGEVCFSKVAKMAAERCNASLGDLYIPITIKSGHLTVLIIVTTIAWQLLVQEYPFNMGSLE